VTVASDTDRNDFGDVDRPFQIEWMVYLLHSFETDRVSVRLSRYLNLQVGLVFGFPPFTLISAISNLTEFYPSGRESPKMQVLSCIPSGTWPGSEYPSDFLMISVIRSYCFALEGFNLIVDWFTEYK
jgi:hypothetical protein